MDLSFNEDHLSRSARRVCERRSIHPVNSLLTAGLDAPNMHMITLPEKNLERVRNIFANGGRDLYVIGSVTDSPSIKCTYNGEEIQVQNIFCDGSCDPKKASKTLVWYK